MDNEKDTRDTFKRLQEYADAFKRSQPVGTCPSCGYCPHCGRGGQHMYPSPQWPVPQWPWTVTHKVT